MMDKANSSAPDFSFYVCPQCRGTLAVAGATLHCSACRHNYPVQHGIPDFISEDLTQSTNPVLRQVKWLDLLARVYESKVWYPVVLRLFAGRGQLSFAGLINLVQEMIGPVNGVVLDVACGPAPMAAGSLRFRGEFMGSTFRGECWNRGQPMRDGKV